MYRQPASGIVGMVAEMPSEVVLQNLYRVVMKTCMEPKVSEGAKGAMADRGTRQEIYQSSPTSHCLMFVEL